MNRFEFLEGFPFRLPAEPDHTVALNSMSRGLLEMIWLCWKTQESAVALSWPVKPPSVAIFHSLLQLNAILTDADSIGDHIFTILWPWNHRVEHIQKRILVDRETLTTDNFAFICQHSQEKNGLCLDFHYALNNIKDLDPSLKISKGGGRRTTLKEHLELQHPTLFEITPQAQHTHSIEMLNEVTSKSFLAGCKKYCRGFIDDRTIKFPQCPYYMLGVPASVTSRILLASKVFRTRRPDIVLFDLIGATERIGQDWHDKYIDFLSAIETSFSDCDGGLPPALVVTDVPFIFNKLYFKTLRDYEKKRKAKNSLSGCAFLNLRQDHFEEEETVRSHSLIPSFTVAAIALDMIQMLLDGRKLRDAVRKLGSDELAEAIDFLLYALRKIINMPGGWSDLTAFLQQYVQDSGAKLPNSPPDPWKEFARVSMLVANGQAGAEKSIADELLLRCRGVIESISDTTPMKSRLQDILENVLLDNRKAVFVFPNWFMRMFAEWMFDNGRLGEGINTSEETKPSFLDENEALSLDPTLMSGSRVVYFVLPGISFISKIIARHQIPQNINLLCDGATSVTLLRHIEILDKVPGLTVVKPRLNAFRTALAAVLKNDVTLLGDIDELDLLSNALSFNMRDGELNAAQGHPVIIITEDHCSIKAHEGSLVLRYDDENYIQPFSRVTVADLQNGDKIFFATPDFFDATDESLISPASATTFLMNYHQTIQERVNRLPGTTIRDKARSLKQIIQLSMPSGDFHEVDNLDNLVRWINVEDLINAPREVVKPNAPKLRRTFLIFTKALEISENEADIYWGMAIQSTRKARIRAGVDRTRVIYRLLIDSSSAGKLISKDKIRHLIDVACRYVFTVHDIKKECADEHQEH